MHRITSAIAAIGLLAISNPASAWHCAAVDPFTGQCIGYVPDVPAGWVSAPAGYFPAGSEIYVCMGTNYNQLVHEAQRPRRPDHQRHVR